MYEAVEDERAVKYSKSDQRRETLQSKNSDCKTENKQYAARQIASSKQANLFLYTLDRLGNEMTLLKLRWKVCFQSGASESVR